MIVLNSRIVLFRLLIADHKPVSALAVLCPKSQNAEKAAPMSFFSIEVGSQYHLTFQESTSKRFSSSRVCSLKEPVVTQALISGLQASLNLKLEKI